MASRKLKIWGGTAAVACLLLATRALYPQAPDPQDIHFAAPGATTSNYTPPLLGVATHFGAMRSLGYTSGPIARDEMKQIGANSYRDGIAWASFHFPDLTHPVMFQKRRVMDFLPVAGARPLLLLGTPPVEPSAHGTPMSDAQLAQFAAYTKAAVQATRQYRPLFEVWNEWNMKVGNAKPAARLSGAGDPSDARAAVHYAPVAKAGVKAVKNADPNAMVVVGAVGEDAGWLWTQAIVRDGALEGADGLSVHLYNQCTRPAQRNAPEMIGRLEALQAVLRKQTGGKTVPIYVTEFGWPTGTGKCTVTPERQAYNFAHYILQSSALPWLRGSWIYELKDEGQNPADIEDNFGIYTFDDKPKAAACFVREARAIVANAKSVEVKESRPGLFVLRAVMADHQVLAVWTSDMPPSDHFRLASPPTMARTMCGAPVNTRGDIAVDQAPFVANYDLGKSIAVTFTH